MIYILYKFLYVLFYHGKIALIVTKFKDLINLYLSQFLLIFFCFDVLNLINI